ncbi:MAG TPA: hypothetical protein VD997_09930 [Phycisphaerales bacterium]|nr:hypothetical protein [Phycisphaerales bacterium]
MSKMNTKQTGPKNTKPAPKPTPKPAPKNVIPKAPPKPQPSPIQKANTKLNQDEGSGHSRSRHVGMTDKKLVDRKIDTATSFKTKHDQNKVAASGLGTKAANNAVKKAISTGQNQAITVKGSTGRTASITRVVTSDGQKFNAKVTESKMVMQGGTGKVLTTYATKGTMLPKPAPGPNLKPSTPNKNVKDIASGAGSLRKVPAPVARTGMPMGKVVDKKSN